MRIDEILTRPEPSISVELFPPKTDKGRETMAETIQVLSGMSPSYFSVTCGAGGTTREGTLEAIREIREGHGIEAMPHQNVVGETREAIEAIVDRAVDEGVENILALRGDPPQGSESFIPVEGGLTSSVDLISLIAGRHPDVAIGASCFPEVHPEAKSLTADLDFLKRKVDAGATFLITQLFFDNRRYFDFVERARDAGITVPIIAGVMPITSFAQIIRFCGICQATIPKTLDGAMRELGGDLPAEAALGLAWASQQCAELLRGGAPGIHLYALNRWPATRAIIAMLRATRPWETSGDQMPVISVR